MQPPAAPPASAAAGPAGAAAPLGGRPMIDPLAAHQVSVEWSIPADAEPGVYRIRHQGAYKNATGLHEFSGHCGTRVVE
jgi:hypothetical protein